MSGIECAGLVLAVLPLIVEAAKAYSDGLDSVLDVTVKSRYDQNLQDFYDDFYAEVCLLGRVRKQIHVAILVSYSGDPSLLEPSRILTNWQSDPGLEAALRKFFGSEDQFNEFTLYARRLLTLIDKLFGGPNSGTQANQDEPQAMFTRLRDLAAQRQRGNTKSTLMERFRFSRKQSSRDTCLERLRKWTSKLSDLTTSVINDSANIKHPIRTGSSRAIKTVLPPPKARDLFKSLHDVLCSRQNMCCCTEAHRVQLCVTQKDGAASDTSVRADFLVAQSNKWQEANVTIMCSGYLPQPAHAPLERVCLALQCQSSDCSLGLLVEDLNSQRTIWQLGSRPKRLHFLEPPTPVALSELLHGPLKLTLKEKRKLALLFARSLFLYHDSPWLPSGWVKDDIFFFYKSEDEPDLEHPFISAWEWDPSQQTYPLRNGVFHRAPSILALGILFIEIYNEKPIESWRNKKDKANVTVNTDLFVALRVVEKMDDSPSRSAIKACLDMEWVAETRSVQLSDEDMRLAFLSHVIAPLEQEIEWDADQS